MRKWIFILAILYFILACGHLERSAKSGYSSEIPKSEVSWQLDKNSLKLLAELGMTENDLLTPEGQKKFQEKQEIIHRESLLFDERERKQYYQNLPWFKNTEEQVEFLRQNGYYGRLLWLRKRGIGKRPIELDSTTEDLIASKDIALGMQTDFVKRSWGTPDSIEIAGNPLYGNERWRYKRYSPTPDGFRLQSRIIYFESGKVVGWEQRDQ